MDALRHYREVWCVDFEFGALPGERPEPRCMVGTEFHSGRTIRAWADELAAMPHPPFPVGADALFVAYYSPAEFSCFEVLDWPMPERTLDLFTEFRVQTNGMGTVAGNSLLGAMVHFGLSTIAAAEKTEMRELALRGGEYSDRERHALLDYCQTDVQALVRLLPAMLPHIDLPRALLRGRYMAAVAAMEANGVPIDKVVLKLLRDNWDRLKGRLIREINKDYGVFVPGGKFRIDTNVKSSAEVGTMDDLPADVPWSFSAARFAEFLKRADIPWPRLDSGNLALDDDTFRQMSRTYPIVAPLRELRHTLGEMRLFSDLAVGAEGRNRCLLSPFRSVTGRNQPSNAKFIFGPSCWLRSLIQPEPGWAVAYVDWSQQEFGIAAALSSDTAMMTAYSSGDPYLTFAKQAGAVPVDGTKQSHPAVRELFKTCALGVQYGMMEDSLARRMGKPPVMARELLRLHHQTYPVFWRWSKAAVDHAMLRGHLQTVFGWRVQVGPQANPRSLANFPMQANGAEMLRLACCLATERGIRVAAPVHDAVLVEGSADDIEDVVTQTQAAMAEASRVVLSGFELRSDAKIVRHPDRYSDPRGVRMWDAVMAILNELGVPLE